MDSRSTAPGGPARRSYHHGDLRVALREAAERILVERGAAEVSLREVARAVGVSHAAPYRHYASREALLADIAAGGFDRLRAVFAALPERPDAAARFVSMARAYVEFAVAQPAIYRLMLGPEVRKADHPVLAEAGHRVLDTLRRALLALGVPAPATDEAMAAWGFAHGLAQLLVDGRLETDPAVDIPLDLERLVERSARIYVAGLAAA
ncbi:TetR/AcrR family transcriptional regulator [Rubrivivax gelatinosus]|uniref:TetR family transcriptional regulator n=1 Tax=Rubrivivax gelatinosus TaxID=28068 RepID=A0A4R2MFU5_RUBGE|nr:TetR/AcrR family transcriptional regulator [Rubrivivax gelatinosus]MBK1686685.1 TetR family transcriptional regulator [Rubrivivax gelatinosus]TCP05291.1 TetR family transcriptional regulator [Rubrivivax gelatinosus]